MKKILIIAGICSGIAFAQNTENLQVKAPVKSVILYLDGAEVAQSKQVNLNAGRTLVTFTGLSPKLISKSIQVNVGNDVTVLSVSDKINFLTESKETPRLKQIKDSIEMLNDANMQLQWQIDAYNGEKAMLSKNEAIGGNEKGVSAAELKLALDLYRARLKDIHAELFTLVKKRDKTNLIIAKLNKQMSENGEVELPTAEISILVSANAKTSTNIDLKYVVKESGWAPSYDLIS
ncbi:MAG: mucoidy inhibitor MuiA family protein, partial [Bacteroidetes bacterium]|nr:mucoidy inhibitor MuiA family protein [Bacteroidota bacterium]